MSAWVADVVRAIVANMPAEPRLDLSTPCIRWPGEIKRNGYGRISSDRAQRRQRNAHRVVYEEAFGVLPDDQHVGHVCHEVDPACAGGETCAHRACVNPLHLQAQTPAENARATVPARRTECVNGHPYNEANTRIRRGTGRRQCRACDRAATKAAIQRRRAA